MSKPATNPTVIDFKHLQRNLWTRKYLTSILDFDGETVAPPLGATARAEAMGVLAEEEHALTCSQAAQDMVAELTRAAEAGELDEQTATELAVFARDQREALALPADEVASWARLTSEANAVWHKAKADNDWATLAPYIDRIVEALKRQASYLDSTRDPYDVWLDQYERGMDTAAYDAFFSQVKETVVPLVHEIAEHDHEELPSFMTAHVPSSVQLQIARDLLELEGIDMEGCALACVEHPFSDGFAPGDVRVTTHIYENDAFNNVFSVMHEGGHAIYEANVDPAYAYTCLSSGTSMGIHESQSRFFENYIGRNHAFASPLLDVMRKRVPGVYTDVTPEALWRATNMARPGLIRMDADELTYPLHIMLRYDIERMLFAGEAKAADVPALWRSLTKDYLGLEVPDDTHGCLQDTHWSGGSFGYFPSYALGSAYGAQYLDAMKRDGVDVDAACAAGDLAPVRTWLREKIWRWGRCKDAPELIESACGAPFDATFYCTYLERKFRDRYSL